MGFEFVPLEQLDIQLIDGDRGKNYPKQNDFTNEGYCLFLSAKNVTKLGFEFEQQAYISEDKDNQLRAGKLQINDIVLTTRGTIGNVALYHDGIPFDNIRINSGMLILRANAQRWNSNFLYFVLTSEMLKQQISALTSGSAVPQLPARDIKKFLLPDIPKYQQDRIVNQLSKLNNKIALNRQINQILEQMTQTLFKSWFVDFDPVIDNALDAGNAIPDELQVRAEQRQALRHAANKANQSHSTRTNPTAGDALATPYKPLPDDLRQLFPNEFEESELGWVPKGWGVTQLSQLAKVMSGKRPPSKGTEKTEDEPIPVWGGNGIKWFTNVPLSNDKYIITGRVGTLGTVYKVDGPSWASDNALVIRPVQSNYYEYVYQTLDMFDIQSLNSGSTQPLVTQTAIKSISFICPSNNELLEQFQKLADSYDRKINSNIGQNDLLIGLRDILLPKLISGELRLDEVESTIVETTTA